jgi:hypothetical protein
MTARTAAPTPPWIEPEYAHAPLPDARLQARQVAIGARLAAQPAAPLPAIMVTDAELEACYRFAANPRVTPAAILAPHRAATFARARAVGGPVVAIHDGTEFDLTAHPACAGLGRLRQGQRGFVGHVTLLVTEGDAWEPLGVPAVSTWVRPRRRRSRDPRTGAKRSGPAYARLRATESAYWRTHIADVATGLGPDASVVHVFDAGGEHYDVLAACVAGDHAFVTRLARDRRARAADDDADDDGTWSHLGTVLAAAPVRAVRAVTVAARGAATAPRAARARPARARRTARVGLAAARVTLRRPRSARTAAPPTLDVHAVAVTELDPPAGVAPVCWVLLTCEPIATVADLARVVGLYVHRFAIEVYFDALKNGCLAEQRRLQTVGAQTNLLALAVPVAWQLLRLRALARAPTPRPAAAVLSPTQLAVLRACTVLPLGDAPDAAAVLQAVAKLGGNIKKREPGWRVLMRGLERLMQCMIGWKAAKSGAEM